MKTSSPQKQVKCAHITRDLTAHHVAPVSALKRRFSLIQGHRSQQASCFWSRRCFCCCSGLWLTFIGPTTARPSCSACTRTSTRFSRTSRSSAGSTHCWIQTTPSHCRTSSQLWDGKAELKGRPQILYSHIITRLFNSYS